MFVTQLVSTEQRFHLFCDAGDDKRSTTVSAASVPYTAALIALLTGTDQTPNSANGANAAEVASWNAECILRNPPYPGCHFGRERESVWAFLVASEELPAHLSPTFRTQLRVRLTRELFERYNHPR